MKELNGSEIYLPALFAFRRRLLSCLARALEIFRNDRFCRVRFDRKFRVNSLILLIQLASLLFLSDRRRTSAATAVVPE